MEQNYRCMKCDATKTIKKPSHMSNKRFRELLPEKVICGFRGCPASAYKRET